MLPAIGCHQRQCTPNTATVSPRPQRAASAATRQSTGSAPCPARSWAAKSQHRPGHQPAPGGLVIAQPGQQAQRNADDDGQRDGHQHQLQRGRYALHDEFNGGTPSTNELPGRPAARETGSRCTAATGKSSPRRRIIAWRSASLASALTSSSMGSPTAYTAKNTTSDTASKTKKALHEPSQDEDEALRRLFGWGLARQRCKNRYQKSDCTNKNTDCASAPVLLCASGLLPCPDRCGQRVLVAAAFVGQALAEGPDAAFKVQRNQGPRCPARFWWRLPGLPCA